MAHFIVYIMIYLLLILMVNVSSFLCLPSNLFVICVFMLTLHREREDWVILRY